MFSVCVSPILPVSFLQEYVQQPSRQHRIALSLREAKPRGFQTGGGFPNFWGKRSRFNQIVSRTPSEMFLVGAFEVPRNREKDKSGEFPKKIGKITKTSRKSQKGTQLGLDMGGCKTYRRGGNVPENALSRNFLDPPEELLVSAKTEQ